MDAKFKISEHLPALAVAGLILLLAIVVPRFLRQEPSSPQQISSDSLTSFQRDCVDIVLQRGEILPGCASRAAIRSTYHVDAEALLAREQNRRIGTAEKIARGDITDEQEYRDCLKSGECVSVPGINFDIDINTAEGQAARADFWHLVDNGSITQPDCEAMDICKALVKIGIIAAPPALPRSASSSQTTPP